MRPGRFRPGAHGTVPPPRLDFATRITIASRDSSLAITLDSFEQCIASLFANDFPDEHAEHVHVFAQVGISLPRTAAQQQAFANLRSGRPGLVPPPLASAAELRERYPEPVLRTADAALACSAVGSPATVREGVRAFVERHRPDELILTANIHDPDARLRSFELAMEALG